MRSKSDIQIRRAGAKEMAEVRALTRRAYQPWVEVLRREPLPMNADYDAAFLDHRFDVIGEAGALRAALQTQQRGNSLWIENIAVDPAFHGKGYGSALLNNAETLAVQAGLTKLTLYTNKLMAKNIAIYEGRGFVVTAEEALEHGTVLYMSMGV